MLPSTGSSTWLSALIQFLTCTLPGCYAGTCTEDAIVWPVGTSQACITSEDSSEVFVPQDELDAQSHHGLYHQHGSHNKVLSDLTLGVYGANTYSHSFVCIACIITVSPMPLDYED